MSFFNDIKNDPSIEVFELNKLYEEDICPNKCNLGIGAYKTEDGNPWILPVVRDVEIKVAMGLMCDNENYPVLGTESFTSAATTLLLGEDNRAIIEKRACGIQTLSGTGALRIGAEFLAKVLGRTTFYYSKPSWDNHRQVLLNAGFTTPREYRYWNSIEKNVDIEGLLEDLNGAPEDAVVLFHCCAHNPTGCDPTKEQWRKIFQVVKKRKLFPFFDSAYQGLATGDPEADSWPARYAANEGFEFFCAQSFAKNFGLYNERVGNLIIVTKTEQVLNAIKSQFTILIRAMYSNTTNHGARVVGLILNDKTLKSQWLESIRIMSFRIRSLRKKLKTHLQKLKIPGSWDHVTQQIGMFFYTGLNDNQVEYLMQKYHIYILKCGRINMCGINSSNMEYIARAIDDAVRSVNNNVDS
ncbi:probable aspartate aminotransferase, cytoplasmic [Ctenocephalides felis]|uniref:probable aspartate aminotransferase, cytoplasmic n=1 Tax=Ctenocephalides felis TaxID=7515 RepID=UPI000E6E58C1|nr:probable aspartate aminotransferase, cytoplasmic [Ctenocephalides felis]